MPWMDPPILLCEHSNTVPVAQHRSTEAHSVAVYFYVLFVVTGKGLDGRKETERTGQVKSGKQRTRTIHYSTKKVYLEK